MPVPDEMQSSWRRLWLQIGDPAFAASPAEMRTELALIWAAHDAVRQLGLGVELVSAKLELRVCELAAASLREPRSFDNGYWHAATRRARALAVGSVPWVDVPVVEPSDSTPVELMAEIMSRLAPDRPGVVAPVVDLSLKAERSRPGWRLSGLPDSLTLPDGVTHLGAFAIEEGSNEVLVIVSADAMAPTVDLTEDDVVTGLHERARLEDRLTVAVLVQILRSLDPPSDDVEQLERAMAHATVRSAMASLDRAHLTSRARAVSAAVTYVASVVDRTDQRLDQDWHLTRLVIVL